MKHDPYPHRYKRFTEITGEKHLGYPNRYLVIYPGIQGDMWETVSYRNDAQEVVDHHGGRFVDLDASLRPGTIAELAPHPGEEYPVVVEIVSYIVNGYVLVRTHDQSPRLAWMVEPHRLTPIQEAAA